MVYKVREDHRIEARLTFPAHLHTHFNLVSSLPLFEVVIETSGGKNIDAQMTHRDATSAYYACVAQGSGG